MNEVLNFLIHNSILASLLILLIFMLRFIFKDKINPRIQYALWMIIALRLIIPLNLQWEIEVKNIFPQIQALDFRLDNDLDLYESNIYQHLVNEDTTSYTRIWNNGSGDNYDGLFDILSIVWILGVIYILAVFGIRNVFFQRKILKSATFYDFHDYDEVAEMAGLKHNIPVYISQNLKSPCLIGIFNPSIILTENIIHDTKAIKFALIHEMVHYRQRDNFIRLLGNILCALYWFNPLIWLSVKVSRNDAELSCDSRVIEKIGSSEHLNYCTTLLSIADSGNQIVAAMSTGGRKMKNRIEMILKPPQKSNIALIVAIICISFGAVSFININVRAENSNIIEGLTESISLGNIYEVYQLLTSLENPNDNYKINTIIIDNRGNRKDLDDVGRSLYLGYEFSRSDSVSGLKDDHVKRINKNALYLFSNIVDLENITISYIDKPANSAIKNEKAPISYIYKRSEIEEQYGDLSVVGIDMESLNITPKIDNSFWQSMGGNNVIIVYGYSDFFSSLGIEEKEYEKNPAIVNKLFSKLGDYSDSWQNNVGTLYKFSPNPIYSEWADFMITIDELGNLKSHGVILSDLN
ncbi:M56 family metallopeptidase [Tissierella pigra]|uniref:M56 family metallopeptidase n=1 Tax=Tissierella pigra TaxID=2607614 RepID=A0A6N7XVS7_9FIRM|nr:M56 family metallopeptidase [Tissierella pigra]MBU5425995.1 M56 family metallopeptidase [Tissierella pigra]MSU00644.1 M56 family metallopeptidase [Tissierella pigra]